MSKNKNKEPDEKIIWSIIVGTILALCVWLCVMVYQVDREMETMKSTVNEIHTILSKLEHLK